jgi:subtilisin family serine protease
MAAATQNNTNGGSGIAPDADLMAIACALDQTGTQTTLAQAIACAVDPQSFDPLAGPDGGADIISCSLETANILESVLALAITSAASNGRGGLGVPIFWAVDNQPTPISDDLVCSLADVIAVGRSNRQGNPDGSAYGPKLEFLAPGKKVFGPGRSDGNVFATGTSFATPLAAGVAALVLSRHPDWTVAQLRQHLKDSCDPIPGAVPDACGAGRLNAHRAVM